MVYGRRSYGYGRRRRNVYYRRRRAASRVTKSLQTVGLVDKKVVPIDYYQDNILGVQSKGDYHLRPAYKWFGESGAITDINAITTPSTVSYSGQQWLCSVPKGMDERFGQHAGDNSNDSTKLTYHQKAARAYVLNFGTKSSQHDMGFQTMSAGKATTNAIYNLETPSQGTASDRVKERYFEDHLNLWKLKKGQVGDVDTGLGGIERFGDQFSGDKIYAKSARMRMKLQYADWPLADVNKKIDLITRGYHHNDDSLTMDQDNPIETGTSADAQAIENTVDFLKTSYFQWLAQGAAMRVRYMRVLQLEHKDERHDPDVAHDLFRDWDGETTFGLLGGPNSPSYHRYMEAQVNRKYYKIIKHRYITLRPAKNFVPVWAPTLNPTVMSWNTINYAKVTSNPGAPSHVATGSAATNQANRVGPVSNPSNLTNVLVNEADGTHGANLVHVRTENPNSGAASQADLEGSALKRRRQQGDPPSPVPLPEFVEIGADEDPIQNTVGQQMQMIQVGKGDGTENFNFHFKFNKAIQMFKDDASSGTLAGQPIVYEPYSKKSKNHKIIMVFEPVGVDPKFNLIMQYFMPRVKMTIEGHAVYSSVN